MVNVIGGPLKPGNTQRANNRFKALKNAIPESPNLSQTDKITLKECIYFIWPMSHIYA